MRAGVESECLNRIDWDSHAGAAGRVPKIMTSPKRSEIERTERQSASLKRELRLPDLVLLQVLLIVGLPWTGYAAIWAASHVVLWLAAIAFFYFPLAGTVIYLSRRLPLEGGIYQWAKIGLSPFAGFQSAWNYSFFLVLMYATSGSLVANSVSYVLGPEWAWMTSHKPLILALQCGLLRDRAVGQRTRPAPGALDHVDRRGAR